MAETIKKQKLKNKRQEKKVMDVHYRDARIAERAFDKAEHRAFAPGHELNDWFEAERKFLQEENKGIEALWGRYWTAAFRLRIGKHSHRFDLFGFNCANLGLSAVMQDKLGSVNVADKAETCSPHY